MSGTTTTVPGATAAPTLGKKNLTTIHAVAQALAIGPMFSAAIILGGISRPNIGAGWNATLAVLIAGLGVLAIAYTVSLYARRYAGETPRPPPVKIAPGTGALCRGVNLSRTGMYLLRVPTQRQDAPKFVWLGFQLPTGGATLRVGGDVRGR